MATQTIRAAYPTWPQWNQRLRDAVASLTDEQLAITPGPDRWPLWSIGPGCRRSIPGAEAPR